MISPRRRCPRATWPDSDGEVLPPPPASCAPSEPPPPTGPQSMRPTTRLRHTAAVASRHPASRSTQEPPAHSATLTDRLTPRRRRHALLEASWWNAPRAPSGPGLIAPASQPSGPPNVHPCRSGPSVRAEAAAAALSRLLGSACLGEVLDLR